SVFKDNDRCRHRCKHQCQSCSCGSCSHIPFLFSVVFLFLYCCFTAHTLPIQLKTLILFRRCAGWTSYPCPSSFRLLIQTDEPVLSLSVVLSPDHKNCCDSTQRKDHDDHCQTDRALITGNHCRFSFIIRTVLCPVSRILLGSRSITVSIL